METLLDEANSKLRELEGQIEGRGKAELEMEGRISGECIWLLVCHPAVCLFVFLPAC